MELAIGSEGNALSSNLTKSYNASAFPAPPQMKQPNLELTKAEPEKQAVNEHDVPTAIEQANKLIELFNRDLRFEIHDGTGIVQISIVERNDGKVVKQIPSDSLLDMIAKIKDIIGSLMDVKA